MCTQWQGGGAMITRERKRDAQAQPWRPPGRIVRTGAQARWRCTRVREVTVERGVTIALGEFEFARAEIGVAAAGLDPRQLYEDLREVAEEYLAREEAAITGVPRADQPYPAVRGIRREVRIGNGLTLRGVGKRETVKVDVHLREPVSDGAAVGAVLERARAWVEERLRAERADATGEVADDTGI